MTEPDCSHYEEVLDCFEKKDEECVAWSLDIAEEVETEEFAGYAGECRGDAGGCKAAGIGELLLTPATYGRLVKVPYRAENEYDLVEGILVSRAGAIADGEHQEIIN